MIGLLTMKKNEINIELTSVCVTILFIAFYGEPDLIDAIIHYLMK